MRTEILVTLRCLLCEVKQKEFNCRRGFSFLSLSMNETKHLKFHFLQHDSTESLHERLNRLRFPGRKRQKIINLFFFFPFLRASQNFVCVKSSSRLIAQMVPDLIEWVKDINFCAFTVAVSVWSMDGRENCQPEKRSR